MTTRLYYDEPYRREFDATVLSVEPRGPHHGVTLDHSAFYPTSGGQPFDTGTLGSGVVVDVIDDGDDVIHVVEGGRFEVGQPVSGRIDWDRRFDHMQQHTGQHMLSAAFVSAVKVPTLSFHLGGEVSTIDLARDVSPEDIGRAETLANQVVYEDRPITVSYAEATDAADMGLRKQSKRSGTLRLVNITDFDLSACGGSHVTSTGRIGAIVVSGWERFKGGLRVEFACGARAVRQHGRLRDLTASAVRQLSVMPEELPSAIDRLQGELRAQKRSLAEQAQALAVFQAEALAQHAVPTNSGRLVVEAVPGDATTLKNIASAVASRAGHAVVLLSTPVPSAIVATRAADAPLDCQALVKAMCAKFGGRGGGRPDLAQAGGLSGSMEEMLADARALASA